MKIKDVKGAEYGSIKAVKTDERILLSVNEHDLVTVSEDEFLDLCQVCIILGQKLLQDKELKLLKKIEEMK